MVVAAWAALVSMAPAHAADGDQYKIAGNVQVDGKPIEGVSITVDGSGGPQTVVTDKGGQWTVDVPEGGVEYTVVLDEDTLPEGIALTDPDDDSPETKEVTPTVPFAPKAVNFFIGEGERDTTSFVDQFIERLALGINFGLMLALASVGLSLVFGTTGISNFAHGEMVTFGAVIGLWLGGSAFLGLSPWFALPAAVLLSALLGLTMDAGLWRPLRRRGVGTVQLMIVSIGLSLAMRYVFQYFIGGGTEQLPGASPAPINIGPISLTRVDLISMAIAIAIIVGFALWLVYSRLGKATRAISDNPSLASASGIDVDFVVRIVWVLAAALAGLSGVLYAYYRPGVKWDMGSGVLLLMFAAVTLGGLGTAFGALIGSLIIGIVVETSSLWIPADLRFASALVILIVILLVRPQGILGRRERIG
ncbi:MAG: branched-chain amino acid ABC transporter permease [Nocardioides sp.]